MTSLLNAQQQPTFIKGNNPIDKGSKWIKVKNLSDEFEGDRLDIKKWSADPKNEYKTKSGKIINKGWYGSPGSLFEPDNVTVVEGELRIEAEMFPEKRYSPKDNRNKPASRVYGGGRVTSKHLLKPGYYMEAEIQASQTVMSTAFWLNTPYIPCEDLLQKEVLELDILECVGKINGSLDDDWTKDDWAVKDKWDRIFHSNVFRHKSKCGFKGVWSKKKKKYVPYVNQAKVTLEKPNATEFHVYGCYWKKDGIDFYLDGKWAYSLKNPQVPFLTPMNYLLSSNYYKWIKRMDAESGGFNQSKIDRSTRFKWVRTWKVEK